MRIRHCRNCVAASKCRSKKFRMSSSRYDPLITRSNRNFGRVSATAEMSPQSRLQLIGISFKHEFGIGQLASLNSVLVREGREVGAPARSCVRVALDQGNCHRTLDGQCSSMLISHSITMKRGLIPILHLGIVPEYTNT